MSEIHLSPEAEVLAIPDGELGGDRLNRPIPRPAKTRNGDQYEYYVADGLEMRKTLTEKPLIQVYREDLHKWVFAKGTAKNGMVTTSEAGKALAETRWDKYREAAMQGIMEATGTELDTAAVKQLSVAYASHAIAGGKGGASYAGELAKLAELQRPRDRVTLKDASGNSASGAPGALAELAELMAYLRGERERLERERLAARSPKDDGAVVDAE